MFCYCPFYSWNRCPSVNQYRKGRSGKIIKDCTTCVYAHDESNYDEVLRILKLGESGYMQEKTEKCDKRSVPTVSPKLVGISVGPGDSRLLTKQAVDAIMESDIILIPASSKEGCRAYNIALDAVPQLACIDCECIPFPMSMKEPELSAFHSEVADRVEKHLDDNKTVGFLTIGDASIYSTYDYIERLVREDGYTTQYISGVSSFCAAAARLGIPLAVGSEEIHIIPGSADVEQALTLSGTLVFMKSGKSLEALKSLLIKAEQERGIEVYAVSNCGMDNEYVSYGAKNICVEKGYLTVVIVRQ